jgi:peptide/nickel transport system substrate-binding protein
MQYSFGCPRKKGEVVVIVNPDQSARASIIANKDLAFYECDANAIQLISFNNSKGVFSNKKLREAVSYAIDKEAIIMGAKEGVASSVEALYFPIMQGYPDDFRATPMML